MGAGLRMIAPSSSSALSSCSSISAPVCVELSEPASVKHYKKVAFVILWTSQVYLRPLVLYDGFVRPWKIYNKY